MSALEYVHTVVFPAVWRLLPDKMNSIPAKAMLLAIGLQESRFEDRHQIGGPAGGFWQFEDIGVEDVLIRPTSRDLIAPILEKMSYPQTFKPVQDALDHNDILACVIARLALWNSPKALPLRGDVSGSWLYYTSCWRPGKPHRETWDAFYTRAWQHAQGD